MEPHTSSIDDVLSGSTTTEPSQEISSEPEMALDNAPEKTEESEPVEPELPEAHEEEERDVDDYGNETRKAESKTYTEDEVSERINKAVRERLARLKENQPQANQQPTMQQQQQAADVGFEYDENSNQEWQHQLKDFIRQTNEEVQQEQMQRQQAEKEASVRVEFEEKFHNGMSKFQDFREVVGSQPITDAMTMATRAMKDPAAFLYAASKRHSEELKRIANTPDPYTQMVEIGRLEERMKKARDTSKAPRPLKNTREDSTVKEPENKEQTIEDLIAANDARRLKNMRNRRG